MAGAIRPDDAASWQGPGRLLSAPLCDCRNGPRLPRHTPNLVVASSPFARYTSRLRYGFVFFESVLYLVVKHQPRPIAGGNGEKMSLGLLGRKVGMMRIFTDDGDSIPVTVLDVSNNRVAQIKTPETDGYTAVQVAFGQRRASRVNKAVAGHHAKAGVEAGTDAEANSASMPLKHPN